MSKIPIPYEEQTPSQRWSNIVKDELRKRHWVRRELAERFDVVTSTVTFWIQGKSYPKNEYIYMMADLMQVPPSDLINYLNNTKAEIEQNKLSLIERTIKEADTLTDEETVRLITALVVLLAKKKDGATQLTLKF
jgi:transcriptional regulator with XRE-family HTH domain